MVKININNNNRLLYWKWLTSIDEMMFENLRFYNQSKAVPQPRICIEC